MPMNERRTLTRRLRDKGYRRVAVRGPLHHPGQERHWSVSIYDNADGTRRLATLDGAFPDVLRQVVCGAGT